MQQPDAILADIWARLSAGAARGDSPFHIAALAIGDEIAGATVRTVVLRRVDPAQRALLFHTDRRSPKFGSLHLERKAGWLFYDPFDWLQLRIQTTTTLHTTDAIAHELWSLTTPDARAMYGSPLAPGTPLPGYPETPMTPASNGRDNFAVVRAVIAEIDWLLLHPAGHRRLRFAFTDDSVTSTWLAP